MPHRLITVGIVLFWLAMTGLLIQREVVPYLTAEDVPIAQIDFLDEISSPLVGWTVLKKNERIGSATSRVVRNDDGTFDFRASYHFDKFNMDALQFKVRVTRMEQLYRVTAEGKMKAVAAKFSINFAPAEQNMPDTHVEVRGEVEDSKLEPRLFVNNAEQKLIPFGQIDMKEQASVINPMLPVNKVRGLRDGKSWKVTLFDASSALPGFIPGIVKQSAKMPMLIASVSSDTLFWDRKLVACYKVEYFEPGKEDVMARTWVRRIDGLVLQQEASRGSRDMTLTRVPN